MYFIKRRKADKRLKKIEIISEKINNYKQEISADIFGAIWTDLVYCQSEAESIRNFFNSPQKYQKGIIAASKEATEITGRKTNSEKLKLKTIRRDIFITEKSIDSRINQLVTASEYFIEVCENLADFKEAEKIRI